jgi:hypothetical protein
MEIDFMIRRAWKMVAWKIKTAKTIEYCRTSDDGEE